MTDHLEPGVEPDGATQSEEEPKSLRRTFAQRRLSIQTMDASLAGTAVLLVLRDAGGKER